jgi:site-specific recombinase XerD
MNVEQAITRFVRGYRSINTQRAYSIGIGQFCDFSGARTVDDLDPNKVMDWVDTLEDRELSPRTIQQYTTAVTGLMSFLKEEEIAEVSGDDYLKLKQRLKRWNQNHKVRKLSRLPNEAFVQAAILKSHLEDSKDPRRHLYYVRTCAWLDTLAETGCRIFDSAHLKRADLNQEKMTARVEGGKGNKDRDILWKTKEGWDSLMRYLVERDRILEHFTVVGEEPVFSRHDYHAHARHQIEPIGINSLRVALRELCKRAGVPYFNPHSLRHRAGTELLNRTGNLEAVRIYLGHEHLSTTADTYMHLANEKVIEVVRGG